MTSNSGIVNAAIKLPEIYHPEEIFNIPNYTIQQEVINALDLIALENECTCVPVDDQILQSIRKHTEESADRENKQIYLNRLGDIMSRFDHYEKSYIFYYASYDISSTSSERDKRLHYNALLGIGTLLSTDVLTAATIPCQIQSAQSIFKYLNDLFPNEAASCYIW